MASTDVDTLLKPISESEPCGPDLRHDGRYMQVVRDAEGKSEDPFTNTPAEDPNWREVRDGCVELLAKSRDLRLGVLLAVSEAKLDGYVGLERGLRFVRGCVETYWDSVHPQLDPEDNNDPLMRANILSAMCSPIGTYGDTVKFLERVRALPLCESRQLGRYSLEDFALASGALTLPEGSARTKPELNLIEAALAETDLEQLQSTLGAVEKSLEHAKGIDSAFNGKVKTDQGIDCSGLIKMLGDGLAHLKRHVALKTGQPVEGDGSGGGGAGAGGSSGGGAGGANGGGGGGGGGSFSISGEVRTAAEAVVALEAVCRYYEQREPSSPVALIVQCAKQCVNKDFLTLTGIVKPEYVAMLREISQSGNPPTS